MADVHTKKQRSRNMAAIRSRGNKSTEQKFLKILKDDKIFGWKCHENKLPGNPDFVFIKSRLLIFLDGCFWHGCKKHFSLPASNRLFWKKKIEENIERDKKNRARLRRKNWKVLRIWEHEIKNNPQGVVRKIKKIIKI